MAALTSVLALPIFLFCLTPTFSAEENLRFGARPMSLRFELPDNEVMCFYQEFTSGNKWILEYKVLKGGKDDVDASVESPNGKILYKESKKKSDVVPFITSRGLFKICFSNEFSTITHKVVYFELKPEDKRSLAAEAGNRIPGANTQMEESTEKIHQAASSVVEHQTQYRLNEAKGRYRAEDLHQRVHWWSICEALVILCAGFGQVAVLRGFFADRRFPSRAGQL